MTAQSNVRGVQALTIANALKFYARHGQPINRAYTPKNMMATGQSIVPDFKPKGPRDYLGMAEALRAFAYGEALK